MVRSFDKEVAPMVKCMTWIPVLGAVLLVTGCLSVLKREQAPAAGSVAEAPPPADASNMGDDENLPF